jgi:hypothetical protein
VIVAVFAQRFFMCSCGKRFAGDTPAKELYEHLAADEPHKTKIETFMMCSVGTHPRTLEEIEADFGVPAAMIDLDPPHDGLYYERTPTWRKWAPW